MQTSDAQICPQMKRRPVGVNRPLWALFGSREAWLEMESGQYNVARWPFSASRWGDLACREGNVLAYGRLLGQEKIGLAKCSEFVYGVYGWLGFCYLPYTPKANFF